MAPWPAKPTPSKGDVEVVPSVVVAPSVLLPSALFLALKWVVPSALELWLGVVPSALELALTLALEVLV